MNSEYFIETLTSKVGLPTMNINGYNLHSKYDPIREAKSFVDKNFKPGHIHILFGYGLGYIAEEFTKRITEVDEKLIIIEPILKNIVIEENSKFEVYIETDMNIVKNKLETSFGLINNITLVCSPNYDKICPEIYKQFLENLKNKLYIDRVSENTLIAFSEMWQKNYLFNLKHVVNDLSIRNLEKVIESPIVIASGGPSLTKQLHLVKKYRENFILIASGSTINTLLCDNIIPDYVVSIDGHINNYNHFKDLKHKDITLLYGMYNYFKIRNVFEKNAYFFLTQPNEVLRNHLQGVINENPVILKGGASVAHYAFSIANYMTTGPIALIGQDLAYTNNRSHAINNKGLVEFDEEEILKRGLIRVNGYNDDEVLTDYPFLSMKNTFETLVKMFNSNENIYNCTEGGIKIYGFKQIQFKEFCDKYATSSLDQLRINNLKYESDKNKENLQKLKNIMDDEIKIYEKLKIILKDNLKLLSKNKLKDSFEKSILKKLDKNDKELNKYQLKTCLSVITDPIDLNIIKRFPPKKNETAEEKYQRIYKQNKTLYSEYLVAVKHMREDVLQLIEEINKEIEGVINGENC